MRWQVVAFGKPKLAYAREGIADYSGRLSGHWPVTFDYLPEKDPRDATARLLAASKGTFRIALHEGGQQFTSREFASRIEGWMGRGISKASLLIGGAAGHGPDLLAGADLVWSLGRLTLQHELALLVTMEQVYRAWTIWKGTPYHRD